MVFRCTQRADQLVTLFHSSMICYFERLYRANKSLLLMIFFLGLKTRFRWTSSAALYIITWLCNLFNFPMHRQYVLFNAKGSKLSLNYWLRLNIFSVYLSVKISPTLFFRFIFRFISALMTNGQLELKNYLNFTVSFYYY